MVENSGRSWGLSLSHDTRQGPPDVLPLRRRQAGNCGGGGGADGNVDGMRTTGSANTNGTYPSSSSSSRHVGAGAGASAGAGAGAGAGADSNRDTNKAETGATASLWPSGGGGGLGGRRRRGVPPGVTVADTIPARLRYVVFAAIAIAVAVAVADAIAAIAAIATAVAVNVAVENTHTYTRRTFLARPRC